MSKKAREPRPIRLTDAEWQVMEVVWERGTARARDVHEALLPRTAWSYSTVKTQLTRLVGKGALREEFDRNTAVYTPTVTRQHARRYALRALLEAAFGGQLGSLVQHMVEQKSLSARDRAELRRLLDEQDSSS
jgi:BlaI family penicillinase repressor